VVEVSRVLKPLCLLAVLMWPTAPTALPDVLPPGYHGVRHELVLDLPAGTTAPALVAFPTQGFGVAMRVMPGEPFVFSSKYGTRLYQLAVGEALPRKADEAWAQQHASLAIPVQEVHALPMLMPVTRVRTTLRVVNDAAGLRLLVVGSERFDRRDRPFDPAAVAVGFLLLAAAGAGWLFWLGRRWRARGGA
jgi:hypothetical protein